MNIIDLHPDAWSNLSLRRAQLPHAILLSGPRGIGQYDLARAFAESLLCENPQSSGLACGTCAACSWMREGNHPDFRLLQPEALMQEEAGATESEGRKKPSQQITIDQVRALEDFLHVGTHRQGVRVILINPAEAMNRSTANSLLKSLEEPAAGTIFILVSSAPARLLPTIRSRCQIMNIALPSTALADAWLKAQGLKQSKESLALAGGSPLLAVELEERSEKDFLNVLERLWQQGASLDYIAAAGEIDKLIKADKRGLALKSVVDWSQKWILDLVLVTSAMPQKYFLAQADVLKRLSKKTEVTDLLAFEHRAIQYKLYCEQPLNSRLFLEAFFLSYKSLFRD